MQLETLISSTGSFYYIDRLDEIIKIASLTKAKMFYLNSINSMLYGSFEEPYSIIKTAMPFQPSNHLFFSNTMFGNVALKEMINKTRTFFYVPEYPWILFSENRRASFINGRIAFDHYSLEFKDTITGETINDCLITHYPEDMFIMDGFKKNLMNWRENIEPYTMNPPIFVCENAQTTQEIQWVMQNKVTEGSITMNLRMGESQFTLFIFKALVGSMTKQDSLTINIYLDPCLSNGLIIDFVVHKHKMKVGISGYNETDIHTFVRMLNLYKGGMG